MKDIFRSLNRIQRITFLFVLAIILVGVPALFVKNFKANTEPKAVLAATAGDTGDAGGSTVKGTTGDTGGTNGGKGGGGSTNQLCGFAWGATDEPSAGKNGVGWVSFSSTDCDTDGDGTISKTESQSFPGCPEGGTGTYGVSVDSNQNLVGYAWSSNVGWLKFGGLSSFPIAEGNDQQDANIDGNGDIKGWARFCAGTSPGDCSDMSSRTDGWDGWLSLHGGSKSNSYGVHLNTDSTFGGFSWGSDVVGWLKWDPDSGNGVRYCNAQTLTTTLTAFPNQGEPGLSSTLTATAQYSGSDPLTYSFKCKSSDAWSPYQSDNTFGCVYNDEGNYTAQVDVQGGTLHAQATAPVTISGAQPNGNLSVDCSVSPTPGHIGQQILWRAALGAVGTPPYTYTFDFHDGSPVVFPPQGQTENRTTITVPKTYTTLGTRQLDVLVTDSSSGPGSQIGASCHAMVNIVIRPVIIEQ